MSLLPESAPVCPAPMTMSVSTSSSSPSSVLLLLLNPPSSLSLHPNLIFNSTSFLSPSLLFFDLRLSFLLFFLVLFHFSVIILSSALWCFSLFSTFSFPHFSSSLYFPFLPSCLFSLPPLFFLLFFIVSSMGPEQRRLKVKSDFYPF